MTATLARMHADDPATSPATSYVVWIWGAQARAWFRDPNRPPLNELSLAQVWAAHLPKKLKIPPSHVCVTSGAEPNVLPW